MARTTRARASSSGSLIERSDEVNSVTTFSMVTGPAASMSVPRSNAMNPGSSITARLGSTGTPPRVTLVRAASATRMFD